MSLRPPLPISAYIAPGADLTASSDGYEWVQVAGDGLSRLRTELEVAYGRDDEAADVEPAQGSVVFDDRDGDMSPRNPYGQWFGQLVDGTPVRFTLDGYVRDAFDRTVAAGGWGSPDSSTAALPQAWTPSGSTTPWSVTPGFGHVTLAEDTASNLMLDGADGRNLRVRWRQRIDTMPTDASMLIGIGLRAEDEDTGYWCYVEFRNTGVMSVKMVRRDGSSTTLEETITSVPFVVDEDVECCVEADGNRMRGKVWPVGDPEPAGWDVAELVGRIDGARVSLLAWRLFSGASDATISVSDLRVDAIIWSGDLAELPVRWDKSGNDSTTPAGLAGPLRRLLTSDDEVLSPITRQLSSYTPAGYWTFEDAAGARTGTSAIAGGRSATTSRVVFGESDCPPGAKSAAKLDSDISYVFMPASGDSGDEWSGLIFLKLPSLPASEVPLLEWRSPAGTVGRWTLFVGPTYFSLRGYSASGTVFDSGSWLFNMDPTEWFSIQLETLQDGGDVDYALLWSQVGIDETFWAISGTFAGTTTRLDNMYLTARTETSGTLFCHAYIGPETLPYVTAAFLNVAAGWESEPAGDRIARLFQEAGETVSVPPTTVDTPMGPQPQGQVVPLVRECVAADAGVLMEDGYGYRYDPRGSRYAVPVRMELTWSGPDGGDLAEAPDPVDDDQRRRNRMTVRRVNGGEATSEDAADQVRRGLRKGTPGSDLNLWEDDQLPDQASWRLAAAVWDEPRWPRIVIDLVANPHLIPQWLSCRIGSRILVHEPKSQMAGQWIDLIIEGAQVRIGAHRWRVEMACSPALLGDTAHYEDPAKRKDSASTTLAAAVDADDTLWHVTTDHIDDCWSQTNLPYPWLLDGEEVEVVEMTAPGSLARIAGGFETGVTGWTVTGGTFVQDAAAAHSGDYGGRFTVAGSPVQAYVRPGSSTLMAEATPGEDYTASMWVRCSVSRNIFVAIDWHDSGGGYLSTLGDTIAVVANTWTLVETTQTCPVGAAFASYGPTMGSSPANGTVLDLDEVDLTGPGAAGTGPFTQTATVVRGANGVTVSHDAGASVRMARRMLARYAL
jgi:hypothetical protein